jgi:virulence factor Mce-like protein
MRSRLRRGIGWALGFAAVVAATIGLGRSLAPTDYVLRFPTQDASGLYPGSEVMIAGAQVGSVTDVSVSSGGLALVTIDLQPEDAPVHRDATVAIRPMSLLGEMYVALDPGQSSGTLPSGSTLPGLQVDRSTDLQQVIDTFDAPTRQKLQTLIDELGGGLAGEGQDLNTTLAYGKDDLEQLASIATTLAQRSQDLETVIQELNVVLGELARSDRRQELAELIQNTEQLLANLDREQAQLQRAVTASDAALARAAQGLGGTESSLAGVFAALPTTVSQGGLLLSGLATDSGALLPHLNQLIQGIEEGPLVFGGEDATGYATRISLVVGCSSAGACLQPAPVAPMQPAAAPTPTAPSEAGTQSDQALLQQGLFRFLLGGLP